MVKEYLEKTRDEFLDTKCNLSEKLVSAENHYKENLKIIQMILKSLVIQDLKHFHQEKLIHTIGSKIRN